MKREGSIFYDRNGFTTTGMVIALVITLSLLFTAAQVYRIQSASAEVQDVADAAALAAENQVAEFMLVARYCDAIVLSLSLTGIAVTGLGIVTLCTPVTAELSGTLIKAGKQVISARNNFADRAGKALNKLQEALPFLSAACAASVAAANNAGSQGSSYLGIAMLVPSKGEKIKAGKSKKTDELVDDVEENADEIRDDAKRAEEAAEEANRSKERAFARDCGDAPGYCMYERAASLAGLSGAYNPSYESVDAWSFAVALERARNYYWARLENDTPAGGSVHDQAQSQLRKLFYRYAVTCLQNAYVYEDEDGFDAYFPRFPENLSQMSETSLYTDACFPITINETETQWETEIDGVIVTETQVERSYVMHAWDGCPNAAPIAMFGSLRMLDGGGFDMCPLCEFTTTSMGSIASASTYIDNGFEYHYKAVAEEADIYAQARRDAEQPKEEVKKGVKDLVEELIDAAKESAEKRIEPEPPGRFGAIAFVVNTGTTPAAGPFASGFVTSSGSLGPRAALAGATLVDEGTSEGRSVLNSALDNLKEGGSVLAGAAGVVLDAWSWLVLAYSDGQAALQGAVTQGLNGLPLIGASGLGNWAGEKLAGAIEAVGLQPAKVGALKPVLVNTGHVAAKGGGQASGLLEVKKRIIAHPAMSTDLFSSVLTEAERAALAQVDGIGDSVEIASIELFGSGGPSIPITIPIPQQAKDYGASVIQDLFGRIRSYYIQTTGVRVWE